MSQPSAGSSLVTSLHGSPERFVCARSQLNTSVSYPECPGRGPTHTPMAAKSPIDVASGATGPCPRRCAATCRKGLRCGKSALPRGLERPAGIKGVGSCRARRSRIFVMTDLKCNLLHIPLHRPEICRQGVGLVPYLGGQRASCTRRPLSAAHYHEPRHCSGDAKRRARYRICRLLTYALVFLGLEYGGALTLFAGASWPRG